MMLNLRIITIDNGKLLKSFTLNKFLLLWLKNVGQKRPVRSFLKFSLKVLHLLRTKRLQIQGIGTLQRFVGTTLSNDHGGKDVASSLN